MFEVRGWNTVYMDRNILYFYVQRNKWFQNIYCHYWVSLSLFKHRMFCKMSLKNKGFFVRNNILPGVGIFFWYNADIFHVSMFSIGHRHNFSTIVVFFRFIPRVIPKSSIYLGHRQSPNPLNLSSHGCFRL